jgi:hypothetical protein
MKRVVLAITNADACANVLRGDMNLYHSISIVTASIFANLSPEILTQPPEHQHYRRLSS